MADFFLDHGGYSTNLGATPTWGVPQEGDGSSKDVATASSIGSILLNAQPAATNLLSICGISFGATSGGTVNYTIGGTLSATVDNIVAAINGCTTAVGTGVAIGAPQLRNLVFARNTAGTTVEIMMRIGSPTLDYSNNAAVGMTSSGWGTAPTITNFAGGSGGGWGWFFNTVALGVSSSLAIGTYGAMCMPTPYVSAQSTTRVLPGNPDAIFVRTGSGKSITVTASNTAPVRTYEAHFVFDSNTKWTGDPGTGKFTINLTVPASSNLNFRMNGMSSGSYKHCSFSAMIPGGLTIKATGTAASGTASVDNSSSGSTRYCRVHFIESSEVVASSKLTFPLSFSGYNMLHFFDDCLFDFQPAVAAIKGGYFVSGNITGEVTFTGCEVRYNISGGADPGPIVSVPSSFTNPVVVRLIDCAFTGYASKFRAFGGVCTSNTATHAEFVVDNCSGVKLDAAYVGLTQVFDTRSDSLATMQFASADVGRQFRYECFNGSCDWNPAASPAYPLLGATQPDGTAWAMKVDWYSTGAHTMMKAFSAPKIVQMNRLTAAVRTVVLEMLVPSAITFDTRMIEMRVSYTDSTGVTRRQTTMLNSAPATSSASWTNAGSYPSHTAKKFTIVTDYAVKQYTDIAVTLVVNSPSPTGSLAAIYLNPEFSIT